jgi:hypothetical protein
MPQRDALAKNPKPVANLHFKLPCCVVQQMPPPPRGVRVALRVLHSAHHPATVSVADDHRHLALDTAAGVTGMKCKGFSVLFGGSMHLGKKEDPESLSCEGARMCVPVSSGSSPLMKIHL